jgi:hypothetical protein
MGANIRRTIALSSDPVTLPISASLSASPACPLWAIGYPSKTVMMFEGVPGVFRRIAGIAPPNIAPTYEPSMRYIPGSDDMPNVNGSSIAMADGAFSPGRAPSTTPANTPMFIMIIFSRVNIVLRIPNKSIDHPPSKSALRVPTRCTIASSMP